jgi:hypothetical protein
LQLYNRFSDFEQPYVDALCEQLYYDIVEGYNLPPTLGIDPDRLARYREDLYTNLNDTSDRIA